MTRSDAYVVLGADFARAVEADPRLLAAAVARAREKRDVYKESVLLALNGRAV